MPLRGVSFAATALLLAAATALGQARKLDPIRRPAKPTPPAASPQPKSPAVSSSSAQLPPIPLPEPTACEQAVRRLATGYGPSEIETILAGGFPNRSELIDALRQAGLRATRVELRIESVESTKILPWEVIEQRPVENQATVFVLASDCIADVRTRLVFDDPATGGRRIREAGRAEWRVRFTHHAVRRRR